MEIGDQVIHPENPVYGVGIVESTKDKSRILVLWRQYGKQYGTYPEGELVLKSDQT